MEELTFLTFNFRVWKEISPISRGGPKANHTHPMNIDGFAFGEVKRTFKPLMYFLVSFMPKYIIKIQFSELGY